MTETATADREDAGAEATALVDGHALGTVDDPDPRRRLAPVWIRRDRPILMVLRGPYTGRQFTLDQPVVTIGRDRTSDIVLDEPVVSRHHARLLVDDDHRVDLCDDGSLNGTHHNRAPISDPTVLQHGDEIQIGTTRMLFLTHPPVTGLPGTDQ